MMMYMYLRYGNQCLPNNVGIGSTNSVDNNMVNLFLEWNAEDPVSEYELERNDVVEDAQGNRNPFIDNPALATIIWGGAPAEDPWGIFVGVDEVDDLQSEIIIFPNPCSDFLTFENPKNLPVEQIMIFNQVGEVVIEENYTAIIDIRKLPEGYYYLKYVLEGSNSTEIQVEPFVVLKN